MVGILCELTFATIEIGGEKGENQIILYFVRVTGVMSVQLVKFGVIPRFIKGGRDGYSS